MAIKLNSSQKETLSSIGELILTSGLSFLIGLWLGIDAMTMLVWTGAYTLYKLIGYFFKQLGELP